jgi:hypothetical protein
VAVVTTSVCLATVWSKNSNAMSFASMNALALMKQCADCQTAISSAVEEQRTIAAQLARQAAELANEAGREPESGDAVIIREEYTSGVTDRISLQTDGKIPARRRQLQTASNFFIT